MDGSWSNQPVTCSLIGMDSVHLWFRMSVYVIMHAFIPFYGMFCVWSLLSCSAMCPSRFAIILMGKRELVALL